MQGLFHFDVTRLLHFCLDICCECGTIVICKNQTIKEHIEIFGAVTARFLKCFGGDQS